MRKILKGDGLSSCDFVAINTQAEPAEFKKPAKKKLSQPRENSLANSNSRCPLNFAVAAVKRRFQDCEAIFYNFGAGLAVGRRSGSVQASFVLICELAAAVTKKHKLSG